MSADPTKQTAKPMTALLNADTELPPIDVSAIPKQLLPVLDIEKSTTVTRVKVDVLAILKIVKHSREFYPTSVNGQLLGLEVDGVLEVTNAFAVPTQPGSEEDMTNYQVEMIQCLREVNVDSSSVGWYQSTRLGDFMQQPLLDVQASYQASPNNPSVVLIHDTAKSEQSGNLSLRAFRLSPVYLELAKSGKFTTKELAGKGLTYGNVLEELPIEIESSSLADVLLRELQWPASCEQELLESLQRPSSFNAKLRAKKLADRSAVADDTEAATDALDDGLSGLLPTRPTAYLARPMCTNALDMGQGLTGGGAGSLLRQMEAIGELIDDHIHDANQWMYWKRGEAKELNRRQQYVQRKALGNAARVARGENAEPEPTEKELDRMFKVLPEPSRLDALLNTGNLNLLTKGVTQSRGPALAKMFMAQGLHEASA
ncbi:hypothetical protein GGI25_006220 [Coemansia spiralis]|uniref:MPN domain-containing protein n=2 Tax=Coemansia TaxID=4863 RepID=A0A9W8G132_9FUNG|nr:hypothetical protein BX070DRAFT_229935 [Coemansia spiralis]KAJ1987489.1 hypothetical protein EDC05_005803 [Coemansia umbellata]KAJ2619083.1 hypothetical protein GGI26_006110 [Coemansia sp. RSA 1358]KAJ2669223.1 hypothetical protein GGI25_006220 [Coemansia spiralis]